MLADAHEEWTRWILIPSDEKHRLLERINSRLQAEGIPPVEMIILKWRVSQLLRDIQRKYSTYKQPPWQALHSVFADTTFAPGLSLTMRCAAEGSMTKGMQSSSGSPIQVQTRSQDTGMQQSSSPQRSEYSPSETRPYDPIRDV
jgi:hypothetical protein